MRLVAAQSATVLTPWEVFALAFEPPMLAGLKWKPATASNAPNVANISQGPAFWRGSFEVKSPADTFLDLQTWGKGVGWINGLCLARFWNMGPTQTAYVPGAWLKAGRNEVVIFDLEGPSAPSLAGLEKPILNTLRPELDFAK